MQMVLALITLAMCSNQYDSAGYIKTTIPHDAVYFVLRALPFITQLVCGIVGIVSSCLASKISKAIYITLTIKSSTSLIVLIWYFSFWIMESEMDIDRENATRCLVVTVLLLMSCLGYLAYEIVKLLQSRSEENKPIENDDEKGGVSVIEARY